MNFPTKVGLLLLCCFLWTMIVILSSVQVSLFFMRHVETKTNRSNGNSVSRKASSLLNSYSNSSADSGYYAGEVSFEKIEGDAVEEVSIFTNYSTAKISPTDDEISIVTQFTLNRWDNMVKLASQWKGYISCAVYIKGKDEKEELDRLLQKTRLEKVTVHLYFVSDSNNTDLYPINIMRNLALDYTYTDFVVLLDADFLPSHDALTQLRYLMSKYGWDRRLRDQNQALVLPAFEFYNKQNTTLPLTKEKLLHSLKEGDSNPFHTKDIRKVFAGGHGPTRYKRWYNVSGTKPYPIKTPNKDILWKYGFEPYVLAFRKSLPRFWDGFVGYGKNKCSFFLELEFMGFEFFVVPQTFVIHKNHVYERGIKTYKGRQFAPGLREEFQVRFIPYLIDKYGMA